VDGRIQFYEVGALPNANVALDSFLRTNRQMLAAGKAISKTDYLKQAGLPPPPPPPKNEALKGREKRIGTRVNSP
jgi:hypothetical protein